METIYKYPLAIGDKVILRMPEGAKVLCVQTQHGTPCLWARVETSWPMEERIFYVRGTGHPIADAHACPYVGTFQIDDGALIFHVFDGGPLLDIPF